MAAKKTAPKKAPEKKKDDSSKAGVEMAQPYIMTPAERQALLKKRRLEAGLKRFPMWVPDDDEYVEQIKAYVAKINKRYFKDKGIDGV